MTKLIPPLLCALLTSGCALQATLTESQQYYSGRAASAKTLKQYTLYQEDPKLTEYVTLVGLLLTRHCERPEVYNGYHFVILKNDRVNAFAAPAGFVFLTTEAIRRCENEDELAALLAHEIAHVEMRHPELAYRASMRASGIASLFAWLAESSGTEAAEKFAEGIESFAEGIARGYGFDQEHEADHRGMEIMSSAGYDPRALISYMGRLDPGERGRKGFLGWASDDHPHPRARARKSRLHIRKTRLSGEIDPRRTERFRKFTKRLKGDE